MSATPCTCPLCHDYTDEEFEALMDRLAGGSLSEQMAADAERAQRAYPPPVPPGFVSRDEQDGLDGWKALT